MPSDAIDQIERYLAARFDRPLRRAGTGVGFTMDGIDYSVRITDELIQDAQAGAYDIGEMIQEGDLESELRKHHHVRLGTGGIIARG